MQKDVFSVLTQDKNKKKVRMNFHPHYKNKFCLLDAYFFQDFFHQTPVRKAVLKKINTYKQCKPNPIDIDKISQDNTDNDKCSCNCSDIFFHDYINFSTFSTANLIGLLLSIVRLNFSNSLVSTSIFSSSTKEKTIIDLTL